MECVFYKDGSEDNRVKSLCTIARFTRKLKGSSTNVLANPKAEPYLCARLFEEIYTDGPRP